MDRREYILNYCCTDEFISNLEKKDRLRLFEAMDEHFRERALELLEYMAKNKIELDIVNGEVECYLSNGEGITKEQLFENFL